MGSKQTSLHSHSCWRSQTASGAALFAGVLLATPWLEGCVPRQSEQGASPERCMASCNRAASDGEACLAWAPLTPETCIRRFSVAQACCGPGDQAECALTTTLAVGVPCVCRGADARGAFVVQGSACKPQ